MSVPTESAEDPAVAQASVDTAFRVPSGLGWVCNPCGTRYYLLYRRRLQGPCATCGQANWSLAG